MPQSVQRPCEVDRPQPKKKPRQGPPLPPEECEIIEFLQLECDERWEDVRLPAHVPLSEAGMRYRIHSDVHMCRHAPLSEADMRPVLHYLIHSEFLTPPPGLLPWMEASSRYIYTYIHIYIYIHIHIYLHT